MWDVGPLGVFGINPAPAASGYAGPGDVLASALAWWGVRGYNAAYSGPAIDIAKEDGSVITAINIVANRLDVASIQAWEVTNGQSYIDKWYDQTGNGFHMVVGNQRAKLIQNSLGVYPSGRFLRSHGDYYKVASGITQALPFFVSVVGQRTANFTIRQGLFSSVGTSGVTFIGFDANANTLEVGFATASGTGTTDSAFHAVQTNFNSDPNSDIMADGTRYTGLSAGTAGLSGQMGIGADTNPTAAGLDGDICEVGVWAGLQSSGTETAMNTNQHGTSGYNF